MLATRLRRCLYAIAIGLPVIGWLIARTLGGGPQPILAIAAETSSPYELAFSPDAKRLAFVDFVPETSHTRQSLRVVEISSGRVEAVLDGVSPSFAWNQDGSLLAVASSDGGAIQVWNASTWRQEQQIAVRELGPGDELVVTNIAFGQDNTVFATEGFGIQLRGNRKSLYRALAWRRIHGRYSDSPFVLAGNDGRNVLTLAVGNVNAETRVAIGYDSRDIDVLRLIDRGAQPWDVRKEYSVRSCPEAFLSLSRNGEVLITKGKEGGQIFHLSEHAWQCICEFGTPFTSSGVPPLSIVGRYKYLYRIVKLSDDGRVGVCKDDHAPVLIGCSTCKTLLQFPWTTGGNTISGDGRLVATGSDQCIRVYRIALHE